MSIENSSELDAALQELRQRKDNRPTQVRNDTLPAGSPMYFYCRSCGHESDVLPEDYTGTPKRLCPPCQSLADKGWLPSETTS